jgi:hypothetical protein
MFNEVDLVTILRKVTGQIGSDDSGTANYKFHGENGDTEVLINQGVDFEDNTT